MKKKIFIDEYYSLLPDIKKYIVKNQVIKFCQVYKLIKRWKMNLCVPKKNIWRGELLRR